jgi:POT family proton-dependent oligopeptide transporter
MDKSLFAFPRGFLPLTLVLTLGMAGFALVQGLLTLYCGEVLNLTDQQAYLLNSVFITLIFSLPLLGGYISEKWLGYVFSTIFCLIIAIAGLYSLCFQSVSHFYIGLALFTVGNSIAVACLYVILGRLLRPTPEKRIAGFTIAYTCMNIGALLSLIFSGSIIRDWGYQSAFLISTILLLSAIFTLFLNLRYITPKESQSGQKYNSKQRLLGMGCIIVLVPIVMVLLRLKEHSDIILVAIAVFACVMIFLIWRSCSTRQRRRLTTFLVVTAFGVSFWALYALEPSVLTLFVERNVNREFGGFSIPSSDFFSLNPLFIIILGIVFSLVWLSLPRQNRTPSLPYLFAIGISLVGGAYLLLSASTYFTNESGLISVGWIIVCYVLLSAAELFISPVGLSMVGTLAPENHEGTLMGVWLLSNGFGGSLSWYLSEATISPKQTTNPLITNGLYGYRFCEFGLIALLLAVILALLAPRILGRLTKT